MSTPAIIHIDGGSRGNPGPAAYAVVIEQPGQPTHEAFEAIGTATNNVAEYTALLVALKESAKLGLRHLHIHSDSELLVKQMNGEYRVKNPDLQELFLEASVLRKQFDRVVLTHVRREFNKRADELCNLALDGKRAKSDAPKVQPTKPKETVGDSAVRDSAVECLQHAAKSWAANGANNPPAALVWDQLWSILQDANVLKKRKA